MFRFLPRFCLLFILLAFLSVIVRAQTTLTITSSASSNTACEGTSVTFTATATGGTCSYTYKWLKNGNTIAGETGSTYTSTTLADGDKIKAEQLSTDK